MASETFQSSASSSSSNDVRPNGAYPKVESDQHPPLYATYYNQHPYATAPQMLSGFHMGQDKLYIDATVRIAVLEKELEQCKLSKGEAEIALLRLVHLMPSKTRDAPSDNNQGPGVLQQQLAQANHNVETLNQQLKQANSLILTLSQTIASLSQSQSAPAGKGKTSPDGHYDSSSSTLLHESDAVEEGEIHANTGNAWPSSSVSLPLEIGPATSAYIRRFERSKDTHDSDAERQVSTPVGNSRKLHEIGADATQPQISNVPSLSSSFTSDSSKGHVVQSSDMQIRGMDQGFPDVDMLPTEHASVGSHTSASPSSSFNNVEESIGRSSSGQIVRVKASAQAATSLAINHPATYDDNDPPVKWNPLKEFVTVSERQRAIAVNQHDAGPKDLRFPDLFHYGLRFIPGEGEKDVYRTVALSNLPPNIDMKTLLNKVRGGKVLNARLLNTIPIIGKMTALVTFVKQCAASAYVHFANEHPIAFDDWKAHVSIVPTPTWPIAPNVQASLSHFDKTRCFEVRNFPNIGPQALKSELAVSPVMKWTGVEYISYHSGTLSLRFCAVKFATSASKLFAESYRYRDCTLRWLADPCDQPLSTLLEPAQPGQYIKSTEPSSCQQAAAFTSSDPQFSVSKLLGLGAIGKEEDTARLEKVDVEDEATVHKGRGFKADSSRTTIAESTNASTASSFCNIS